MFRTTNGPCLRGLALASIFLASLGASFLLLDRLYPFENNVEVLGAKLRRFREHLDEYDTIFIGSSRVRRQLSPALFDRVAREHGLETHSFNLGMSGMFAPEDGYACERIFALKPPRLRRAFIEISIYYFDAAELNFRTTRMTYWHDFERTAFVWKKLCPELEGAKTMAPPELGRHKAGKSGLDQFVAAWPGLALHLRFFFLRLSNFGSGCDPLERLLGTERPIAPQSELGANLDGYLESDPKEQTPEGLAQYAKEFAERQKAPAQMALLPPLEQRNLDAIIKLVRRAGAEPILVIPPSTRARNFAPPQGSGVRVLDFSDPKRWPTLFLPENRRDGNHLNGAGSEIFTRLLAEEALKSP